MSTQNIYHYIVNSQSRKTIHSYIMSYIKIKHFKQRFFLENNVHIKTS